MAKYTDYRINNALILSGSGNPAASLGNDQDMYLDTSNGDWYVKSSGVWSRTYIGIFQSDVAPSSPEQYDLWSDFRSYDTGVAISGYINGTTSLDTRDNFSISTTGDATYFGDLFLSRYDSRACSNGSNGEVIVVAGRNSGGTSITNIEHFYVENSAQGTDFGDITGLARRGTANTSNGTSDRGIMAGGYDTTPAYRSEIQYFTISTPSNGVVFGALTDARYQFCGTSNTTNDRGVFAGGAFAYVNTIDYITISTPAAATDFGDLNNAVTTATPVSNGTNERGVFMSGYADAGSARISNIDYITISTTGNATVFGNVITPSSAGDGVDNKEGDRGIKIGGNNNTPAPISDMEYVTISTPSDATDFGDLVQATANLTGASNS